MNVCTFTKQKLDELDKAIKKILRDNKMHGRQASDERLYMRREKGGRGLKSMRDLYEETKVRVACYMTHSESAWIKTAWEGNSRKKANLSRVKQKMHCKNTRYSTGRRSEENLEKTKKENRGKERRTTN